MDDLLLPQRKLTPTKLNTESIESSAGSFKPSRALFRGRRIQKNKNGIKRANQVGNSIDEAEESEEDSRPSFLDIIALKKWHLHAIIPTRSLVALAMTCKSIYHRYTAMNFDYTIKLHDLATIIRFGKGFGVLNGCCLHIGDGDDIVNSEDISFVCAAMQSPRTQISCTLASFAFQLHGEVSEDVMHGFIRSMKYPSFLPLRRLSLEGSLIGEKGITMLSSMIKKNYLPKLKDLNIARNHASYNGIHSIQHSLLSKCCPELETLVIADNHGEISVLELICSPLIKKRPQLTALDISNNNVSLIDSDSVSLIMKSTININSLRSLDLSFNPLDDVGAFRLLSQMWPLEVKTQDIILIENLTIQHSEIGNKTFGYIGDLMKKGRLRNLVSLSLGMNNATGKVGVSSILEALCMGEGRVESSTAASEVLPNFRKLYIPLNRLSNEGLIAVMNVAVVGGFKHLEVLDVSDVGATVETMNIFLRNFITHGQYKNLKRLVVYGRHPFAKKNARSQCAPEFLSRVQVS
mmetsp:Transcript_13704/g.20520  ORF Transcript_13704/g.20520 Transcript_13704/m.20520 type:complete len:521 (+) Transcript_13704:105-1667(+)